MTSIWSGRILARVVFLLFIALSLNPIADAQYAKRCLASYFATADVDEDSLAIDQSDGQKLIEEIVTAFNLTRDLKAVPCTNPLVKVSAFPTPEIVDRGVPAGEYIIYNPIWVREVIGRDRVQAVALMGHEIGHYLQGHFSAGNSKTRLQQETEADKLAGCAVAHLGGDWRALENFLRRIRTDGGTEQYPSADVSVEQASAGFIECGGDPDTIPQKAPEVIKDCERCPEMYRVDFNGRPNADIVFYAGSTEVTVAQFATFANARRGYMSDRRALMAQVGDSCFAAGEWSGFSDFENYGDSPRDWNNPGYVQTADHPVVCVSFDDVLEYISWLNELDASSGVYRLPTESEWERMAENGFSGGSDIDFLLSESCRFGNVADLTAQAFEFDFVQDFAACSDYSPRTAKVGKSAERPDHFQHPDGLKDLFGNVFEFVSDCGDEVSDILLPDGTLIAAVASDICGARIVKGGSWERNPFYIRPTAKTKVGPFDRMNSIGFRVVMEMPVE